MNSSLPSQADIIAVIIELTESPTADLQSCRDRIGPSTQLLDQAWLIVQLENYFGITIWVRNFGKTTVAEVISGMTATHQIFTTQRVLAL